MMVKYRSLRADELQALETEFVEYLILNGIMADDWQKIKAENREKALQIIDHFSDVVFEKILRKTRFVEVRQSKKLEIFQCLDDRFVVVGLDAVHIDGADFTSSKFVTGAMQHPPAGLEVYTAERPYKYAREMEIFALIENGGHLCDGALFKTLCLALAK
ncbi:MAG: hypothetical protein HC819_22950 [Cyclobacteriaceae bacterium]|nr:hypothetical protein [Cyclobacteriaceae bacterium]